MSPSQEKITFSGTTNLSDYAKNCMSEISKKQVRWIFRL